MAARLGDSDDRRLYYESLTIADKARLAKVFYRAYPARVDDEPVIVIEYWLYYVQNEYRIRGNVFPLWVDGSHPNDLEHIHVIVQRADEDTLKLREVYSSAHLGTMPANRHRYRDGEAEDDHVRFLVELGSHASAPDVDGDGIFTPGADGFSGYKMLWGIRDRGITWTRYNSAYMDARDGKNNVVFEYAGAAVGTDDRHTYRLVPVDDLSAAFGELSLSKQERQALFETDRHWFRRMFGGDNGSSEKLLVPPPRAEQSRSIGIDRFASTERGFLVGTHFNLNQQGVFVGARYGYLLPGAYIPDIMFEADAVATRKAQYVTTQMLVTYPIDGTTTIMAGGSFVTDSWRLERHTLDWIVAVEFPIGHMRLYVAKRSKGPITVFSKEVRLSYFF